MQAPGLPSSCDVVPYWEPNTFAPCPPSIKCHLNQKTQHNCDLVSNVFPPLLSWEWIGLIQAKVLVGKGRDESGVVSLYYVSFAEAARPLPELCKHCTFVVLATVWWLSELRRLPSCSGLSLVLCLASHSHQVFNQGCHQRPLLSVSSRGPAGPDVAKSYAGRVADFPLLEANRVFCDF